MEDDTQNGVDHVDGHRGPVLVISPYSRQYAVNDNYYNQVDAVRTIENILGIKPMNQEDGTATPMYSAFTNHPNFAPYNALPEQVPLTLGVPGFSTKVKLGDPSAGLGAGVGAGRREAVGGMERPSAPHRSQRH